MEAGTVEIITLGWLATTTVGLLVAWGRIEVRLKGLDKLEKEFDEMHPRKSNPGHRTGIRHDHADAVD